MCDQCRTIGCTYIDDDARVVAQPSTYHRLVVASKMPPHDTQTLGLCSWIYAVKQRHTTVNAKCQQHRCKRLQQGWERSERQKITVSVMGMLNVYRIKIDSHIWWEWRSCCFNSFVNYSSSHWRFSCIFFFSIGTRTNAYWTKIEICDQPRSGNSSGSKKSYFFFW